MAGMPQLPLQLSLVSPQSHAVEDIFKIYVNYSLPFSLELQEDYT